jgi:chloride channel 2
MPAGVFGPLFSVGAIFGKFYGHIINKIFKVNLESAFAMAASCGAFSGFSHTISSALMVFEMTGSTKYLSFLLLTSLIANLVGQSLSMGIFDVLLAIKNLPYLPAIKSQTAYTLTAKDIMSKVDYFLEEKNLKIIKALNVMCKMPKNNYLTVPIIDNNGIIKYTVSMQNLYNYITELYEKVKDNYSYRAQSSFKEFFDFVRKKFFKSNRSFFNSIKYKFKKLYMKLKDKERLILNKNFTQESSLRIMTIFEEAVKKDNIFLGKKIQLNDKLLMSDKSILTVEKDYLVLKIQFLFTFLNISHIYVTDEGKLIGIITKQDFINKTQK